MNGHDDDDDDGAAGGGVNDCRVTMQFKASPLWEHTEAFRRAAILGSPFDDDIDDDSSSPSDVATLLYFNIVGNDGGEE